MHRAPFKFLVVLSLILISVSGLSYGAERVVVYSWPKSMAHDTRGAYPAELLKLALSKSNSTFVARPSDFAMSQYRTLKQLENGKGIDVVWTMTNPERETQLRPIRIPIDRGLIGWRLLAIHQHDAAMFDALPAPDELKQFLTVQGTDWPDFAILKANGFNVFPSNYFAGMYDMLKLQRVRFFARSVTEIGPELAALPDGNTVIQVASKWVLHYPAALYFFVRKGDEDLAFAIEQGLETALRDGTMKQLFLQHFQSAIAEARLTERSVVELVNPELPPQTPLQRADLWFDPVEGF